MQTSLWLALLEASKFLAVEGTHAEVLTTRVCLEATIALALHLVRSLIVCCVFKFSSAFFYIDFLSISCFDYHG